MSLVEKRPKSKKKYEELCHVLPGGVNSPVRACTALDMTPLVAESAFEDVLVDSDGNHFIDCCMSWGSLIHGHAHPAIVQGATAQLSKGSSYGVTTAIEEELARKIRNAMPSCEKVRFVSSGTEATMSAVRLARGFTGKSRLITFSGGYHGHADYFLVQAGSGVTHLAESSSAGIPKELVQSTISLPYNDIEAFCKAIDAPDIACVIIEPIAMNMGLVPATKAFLETIREETKARGVLLIFDEVVTGFRLGRGGAQKEFGITPDLTTFGKIVGGGFPLAGFGGRAEIMDKLAPLGPVYQAGTLSGNPVAVRAGIEALTLCEAPGFYEHLKAKADTVIIPIQELIKQNNIAACIQATASAFTLFFGVKEVNNWQQAKMADRTLFKQFFYHMFDRGIYIAPSQFEANFLSTAHSDKNLAFLRDSILEFLMGMKR